MPESHLPIALIWVTIVANLVSSVPLISKDLKVVVCLLIGEEEKQTQELAMDASRGRNACRQESHLPSALIWVTIVADLVSSGALEDLIWVVRVAELTLSVP